MDKIQAAIAKARAAREGGVTQAPVSAPAITPAPAAAAAGPGRTPSKRSQLIRPSTDRPSIWMPLANFAPSHRLMARQRVVTFDNSAQKTPGSAAFDILRTKILQQMRTQGWKRLAITSPRADCGKTTVALNLAFSLSKQAEVHTIVGEMDMRRPTLSKALGISGGGSFAAVLEGKAQFADVAMRPRPNLAFAVNYAPVRNPSELLQSSTIEPAIERIESIYQPDLTIFDMPPMLQTDDTLAFMDVVDCVLLVAAAEKTSLAEIDVCERDLAAQTNVIGVLLNKCRYMDKDVSAAGYD
ncbi:MAG: CpsD/CapB family tyrosine-protein kinase [Pseudomonadota bacterium]